MPAVVQQLRTTDATKIPAGLAPGQIAFNLTNNWMFVGVGGADILVDGTALTAYANTQTILGVANVVVPAKPAAGTGYDTYDLRPNIVTPAVLSVDDNDVNADPGATLTAKILGALVTANTITGAGDLNSGDTIIVADSGTGPYAGAPIGSYIWDGTNFVAVGSGAPPQERIFLGVDELIEAATGTGATAKINAFLIAANSIASAAELRPGDTMIVVEGATGPQATIHVGSFIWSGTAWLAQGSNAMVASTTANGIVRLARDTDLLPTGTAGATTPNALAVPTAAQYLSLATAVGALTGGATLLGTYNASTSEIAVAAPGAGSAGRTGYTAGAKLGAGSGAKPGDYFIVGTAGTIASETGAAAGINGAVRSGDTLIFTGSAWVDVPTGPVFAGLTLNGCTDVSAASAQTVAAANVGGLLIRDTSVTAGLAGAWKMVNVLDAGTY